MYQMTWYFLFKMWNKVWKTVMLSNGMLPFGDRRIYQGEMRLPGVNSYAHPQAQMTQ
jgi:hypothetical protein